MIKVVVVESGDDEKEQPKLWMVVGDVVTVEWQPQVEKVGVAFDGKVEGPFDVVLLADSSTMCVVSCWYLLCHGLDGRTDELSAYPLEVIETIGCSDAEEP